MTCIEHRSDKQVKKQYTIKEGSTFRYWITTYRDGSKMEAHKVWVGDEMNDYIDKIEAEGYEKAYTREEVQEAKEKYERMLARQLVEEKR